MPVEPPTSVWDFAMTARANQRAASGRCVLDDAVPKWEKAVLLLRVC